VSTFLNQLPALVGVALGTLGTILATTVADRARWTRSQSVRWDERRLEAYADYARALKEIHGLALRMTVVHRRRRHLPAIDRETAQDLLAQADIRCSIAWEGVLLVGDEATVTAAREWHAAVRAVEVRARAEPFDAEGFEPAVRLADEGRDRFYVAARRGLSVGGGDVAQTSWLDARRTTQ
jgi:hypothetical protein